MTDQNLKAIVDSILQLAIVYLKLFKARVQVSDEMFEIEVSNHYT